MPLKKIHAGWWGAAAILIYWLAAIGLLCPQWSVYEQYRYGWAVPILCGYLLYLRWQDRPQPATCEVHWPRLLAIAAAILWLPTRVIVEANPIWRVGSWAMGLELLTLALTLTALAGGPSWLKHFGFPFVFYLVAIPWPSQGEAWLVQGLTRFNTHAVVEGLALTGIPAMQHGNVIEISRGRVGMEEACSGIRSLQATLMIAAFFGELYRLTVVRRIGLVATGVVAALLCNMARTFTLVVIASRSGNAEMERWHDITGIAILLGCFTITWLMGTRLRSQTAERVKITTAIGGASPAWLAPTLCVWFLAAEGLNQAWFAFRDQAAEGPPNWSVTWPVASRDFHEIAPSPRVVGLLRYDQGQAVAWTSLEGRAWQAFHLSWGPALSYYDRFRIMLAKSHRPEICLPASGQKLVADRGVILFSVRELALPFHAFQFEDRGTPLHVYYCAWEDGPKGGPSLMRENVGSRLQAALTGSRSQRQRILEMAVWGIVDGGEADAEFKRTLGEIVITSN